ncbi:ABC transporter ATP-binding protein [Thermodesulfobacteriota bacterium]
MRNMHTIQAHDLTREYTRDRGICGLTFTVEPGECVAVLGRNGSGKSTLSRLILGLEKPTSGSISMLGQESSRASQAVIKRLGVVLDTSTHWEHLSGWDNAYFYARSYRIPPAKAEPRLRNLFKLAALHDHASDPVKTYSFGMRRKLSVILALLHNPELLVLDEPTMGIDAHFLLSLSEIVRQRTAKGQTTWICGNEPDWIAALATRVFFIEAGRIIADGSVEALLDDVAAFQSVKVELVHSTKISPPDNTAVRSFDQSGSKITALLEPDPQLIPEIMREIISQDGIIHKLEVRQSSLRDAFLMKTGQELEE